MKENFADARSPLELPAAWEEWLGEDLTEAWARDLASAVEKARTGSRVFPPSELTYAALQECAPGDVKVVILGQDPYHGEGQAHGLAFSVPAGVKMPPSLRNILREVEADTGAPFPSSGCLLPWARQGVLLLNTSLSVEQGRAGSHSSLGWQRLTSLIISRLQQKREGLVFMLWGSHAQSLGALIDGSRHLLLTAPHPSPLSAYRGFFGCRHFSKANAWLEARGLNPINWNLQ